MRGRIPKEKSAIADNSGVEELRVGMMARIHNPILKPLKAPDEET